MVAAVDTDIDGDARPLNYGFDLGADEYDGDLILPEVVGREPAPGATDVAVDAAIVITFSETIHTGSFAYTVASDPGGWSAVWSAGDTVVTLSHLDFAAASSYTVTVSAADDLGGNPLADAPVAWAFTTEQEAPAITSADSTTFVAGMPGSFTVTATGVPTPGIDLDGALPAGVTFADHGDGTASLAGTPAAGATGEYPLMVTASNGVSPDATQDFTLTVNQPPAITSADSTTFVAGASGSFTVTATGVPTPGIDVDGALPAGVTFIDHGDGTASLAGTPAAGATGEYPLMVTASNGVSPDATQAFILTVEARIYLPLVVRSTG
ncbi:MAG: Ig-like domain-containing protein [Chloroflexota bacterium]|nr:Ig-like domain-containing protein [Chloroflexota bacterium]